MVVQLHILGAIFFLELLEIAVLEARRDRSIVRPLIVGLALTALLFVPLLASELNTGFAETRGMLAYFAGAGGARDTNPIFAIAFTLYRVVGWPFVGSVLDAPAAAAVLLAITIAGAVLALRLVAPPQRTAVRWFVGLVIWSTLALAIAAPSLLTIVIGLPNDHYHAFLDPVVILLVAVPLGILLDRAIAAWRSTRRPISALASVALGLVVMAIVTTSIVRRPPPVDPDGGWPAMRDAGEPAGLARRYATAACRRATGVQAPRCRGLSDRPRRREDRPREHDLPSDVGSEAIIVVACDRLFETAMGVSCGGPAEDAWIQRTFGAVTPAITLIDRFDASPRTSISAYSQAGP